MILTCPPVVFVDGINSNLTVWQWLSGTGPYMQSHKYIIGSASYADHSESDGGMEDRARDGVGS